MAIKKINRMKKNAEFLTLLKKKNGKWIVTENEEYKQNVQKWPKINK